jgi:hypothetical protein
MGGIYLVRGSSQWRVLANKTIFVFLKRRGTSLLADQPSAVKHSAYDLGIGKICKTKCAKE